MSEEYGSLSVTVSKPNQGAIGNYYREEIEEDTWHRAELVEIKTGVTTFKGKESPAWIWIYELQSKEFNVKDSDDNIKKANITEKTSQKLTGLPRISNAYKRYEQLTGKELKPGVNVDLKLLFGIDCKLMIKNTIVDRDDGGKIIYHNIEKISIKGLERNDAETEETKENVATVREEKKVVKKEESSKEESTDDDMDDLFADLD